MDTLRDYLNPYRIYTSPRIDVPPGFDSIRVGVSDLEKTTPTVKDFLTTAGDCSGDEVAYCTPICSGRCCQNAPVRENLTTAESAENCRVGEPGYPTANGRQVKNGAGIEEIERGTLDLQVGTAKPGSETVPNCGTETRQNTHQKRAKAPKTCTVKPSKTARWINTRDRMPEPGERVIATNGAFTGEAYVGRDGVWHRFYGLKWETAFNGPLITHWMPLPEPPEVEE